MLLSGLPLYRLSMQDTLHEQTDRIMEQAANLNGYVPPKEKDFSPTNDTEFIATGYRSFQFLVDNLLEMAPTLGSLFENSESLNAQLRQEHNSDVGMASKLYVSWESFNQTIRGLRPRKQRKKRLLYDVKDPRSDPVSARSSSKRSSGSADFSIVSSVFTRNGNNSSGQPTTDTLTTTSTSHPHDPQRDTDPLANFAPLQIIMIQDCSHQTDEAHLGLFDSGTSDNFIVRDVVNKRNLQISRLPETETYQLLESIEVNVSEYVVPVWILKEGHIRREKYRFFVVNSLPDGLHMIIGKDTYDDMGISFFARRRNLVAFPTGEKGSWKGSSYSYASDACMFINGIDMQAVVHKSSSIALNKVEMVLRTGSRGRKLSRKIMQ